VYVDDLVTFVVTVKLPNNDWFYQAVVNIAQKIPALGTLQTVSVREMNKYKTVSSKTNLTIKF
jgi:hypothetical protein